MGDNVLIILYFYLFIFCQLVSIKTIFLRGNSVEMKNVQFSHHVSHSNQPQSTDRRVTNNNITVITIIPAVRTTRRFHIPELTADSSSSYNKYYCVIADLPADMQLSRFHPLSRRTTTTFLNDVIFYPRLYIKSEYFTLQRQRPARQIRLV